MSNVHHICSYRMMDKIPKQIEHMTELIDLSDDDYFNNLQMNRDIFNQFYYLLRHSRGLVDGRYVSVADQVAIFLNVLSHHSKVRIVKLCFKHNSLTVHRRFHNVLRAVLNLHDILLAIPTPVNDDCSHPRWEDFKGCLSALDETLIYVTIPEANNASFSATGRYACRARNGTHKRIFDCQAHDYLKGGRRLLESISQQSLPQQSVGH
ncbi:hypothetical protein ACS0TY_006071 [Phlomoides rotata]